MKDVSFLKLVAISVFISGGVAFNFHERQTLCHGPDERCVRVTECAAFRTREALLQARPVTCGFSGAMPLVCCPDSTAGADSTQGTAGPTPLERPVDESALQEPVKPATPGSTQSYDMIHDPTPVSASAPASTPSPPPGPVRLPKTVQPPPLPSDPSSAPSDPTPASGTPSAEHNTASSPEQDSAILFPSSWSAAPPWEASRPPALAAQPALPERCGDPYRVVRSATRWSRGKLGAVGAHVGRWPWMVLFGRWTDAGLGGWFCGGALITDQHVLMAAHCMHPEEAGTVGAVIGDHDLLTKDEVQHQQRNISRVVRHPRFVGAQNDVAVVRLSTPVELTGMVWPVCLPPGQSPVTGGPLWAAGWGATQQDGHPASELADTPLQLTDLARCEETYRRTPLFDARFPGGFQGTTLCASRVGGAARDSAACPADSGGPLMEPAEGGRYQVVGVWSIGMESCGTAQFPAIYTRVAAYTDWIFANLT